MKGCRPFTDEEIQLILSELTLRNKCLFILGLRTGFRISELLSLNIEDIYDGQNVRYSVLLKKKNTKGKTEGRIVIMHPDCRKWTCEYLTKYPGYGSEPLFRTKHGRLEKSVFHKALKAACMKSYIKDIHLVATHSMRKTFAKKVYEALDENIHKLQRAMGHKSLSSTSAYIGIDDEEICNAIKGVK